jgi:predicted nucleic acid-binding protein
MIILDTNVLSALMRNQPDAAVVRWLDQQPADTIWITSITVFETRFGISLLADSRRRQNLETAFNRLLEKELANRVLDFDSVAAVHAGILAAERQKIGRPVDIRDTLIAGIALTHHAILATRNFKHFSDLEIPVVNPWDSLETR